MGISFEEFQFINFIANKNESEILKAVILHLHYVILLKWYTSPLSNTTQIIPYQVLYKTPEASFSLYHKLSPLQFLRMWLGDELLYFLSINLQSCTWTVWSIKSIYSNESITHWIDSNNHANGLPSQAGDAVFRAFQCSSPWGNVFQD